MTAEGPSQDQVMHAIDNSHKKIEDWQDLHAHFEEMRDTGWIFRGVASPKYYPIPSIGREAYGPYNRIFEERLFNEFKNRAVGLVTDPRFNDWIWLAYAQHIGVPTRLLDWSTSPLIATFFAIESDDETDRVVYAIKYSKFLYEVDHPNFSPFDNPQEGRFSAPMQFDRIRAQRGVFTIHPDPTKIFYPEDSQTLLIPHRLVDSFRKRLFKYGIDYWSIFPDFYGLGRQLAWQRKNKMGLGQVPSSKDRAS
jgi:hypothetical protein